ncbi:MAG: VWA domain-containing protein [Candidatus Nanopelagicales bacterium]|nr:VWA domain-containing protein [Actinomycetota bacterium]MBT5806222.1 VWA domain-containing protein [Actinomycetota bacterium]NCG03490.1 VWA domain-containing protein [Actinomycetales bacterium]
MSKALPGSPVNDSPLAQICAAFGHLLHRSGIPVTPERSVRFASVIELAQPTHIDDLYWLARVTLLSDIRQVESFDRIFQQVFRGIFDFADFRGELNDSAPLSAVPAGEQSRGEAEKSGESESNPRGTSATPGAPSSDQEDESEISVLAAMSVQERVNERDFSTLTPDELALIRHLVDQLPLVPPSRTRRRTQRARKGNQLDLRATLRASHRTGGDPIRLIKRSRTTKLRRVVLIADVSGSMEPYARIYLHLMRGAVQALGAEAFVFATHLTRLTRPLATSQPDVAYKKAADAATDWSGGTRIGPSIKTFIDDFGRRGIARGAVVVIVSDGWEIEDPEILTTHMARLSRLSHHIIWVNPRKAVASYRPLVGGMAAALPHVDTFVSGHSMNALNEVMAAIAGASERRVDAC